MPRSFSAGMTVATNDEASGVVALVFVKIDHDSWDDPIRVVSDGAAYIWNEGSGGDKEWSPCGFILGLPSDSEEAPIGTITIQNVDKRIGEGIAAVTGPLDVDIWIIKSTEFNTAVEPRVPTGTPALEANWPGYKLRNFSVNAARATAEIFVVDPGAEQYGRRVRKGSVPGLYV